MIPSKGEDAVNVKVTTCFTQKDTKEIDEYVIELQGAYDDVTRSSVVRKIVRDFLKKRKK